jgi:hypothetical protein
VSGEREVRPGRLVKTSKIGGFPVLAEVKVYFSFLESKNFIRGADQPYLIVLRPKVRAFGVKR